MGPKSFENSLFVGVSPIMIAPSVSSWSFLLQCKEHGAKICRYGAPGKGNTLLYHCGIGTESWRHEGRVVGLRTKQYYTGAATRIFVLYLSYKANVITDLFFGL